MGVLNTSNREGADDLSFFRSDLEKIKKRSICAFVMGTFYGLLVTEEQISNGNFNHYFNLNVTDELYFFLKNEKRYYVKVSRNNNLRVNTVVVYLDPIKGIQANILSNFIEIEKWVDTIVMDGENEIVERISGGTKLIFKNYSLIKVEKILNSKKLLEPYQDFDKDQDIGAIDVETYQNEKNEAIPYAIGFKTNIATQMFYLDDYSNSSEMIVDCIDKMLVTKNHNYKFYAHNMSEFDGILILKSLMNLSLKHNFTLNVHSDNDGKIISLDIVKKIKAHKKTIKISILDSFLLLPFSLKKLGKVFKCNDSKGIFPYSFLTSGNINYKGEIPEICFFKDVSTEEYLNYRNEVNGQWDCKLETLKYLEKDISILYDIMHQFNDTTFRDFKVNITRIRTISGLAFLIYTANYYNESDKPIYFTKGRIEEFIRKGYYGGIVDGLTNYTDYETYKYDVNSHYPNAMLMPMPGGRPRISTEKNLDKIFGFIEAKVMAPSFEELRVPILPVKLDGKTVLFRDTATGVWWSEELKMARDYGYKILEVKSCIVFDKVEGLFEDYITNIYNKKLESEKENNDVKRLINKLLLNSLYGRLGIKNKNMELKLVTHKNIQKVLDTQNSDICYQANDLFLVKTQGPLDPEILSIINKEKLYDQGENGFNARNPWKSISSSVQFSAAITAYARMNLNKFKNLPGNDYLGGDTDSIILSKPLDPKYVGSSLGLFKLEHVIEEGFYLSKKFYLLVTKDKQIIIRAKGIGNNKLLNYNTFLELFKGNTIKFPILQFSKDYKKLIVKIVNTHKEIKGFKNKEINYKLSNRSLVIFKKPPLEIAVPSKIKNTYLTSPIL